MGANCMAVDINPLAYLITQAKTSSHDIHELQEFRRYISSLELIGTETPTFDFHLGRRVRWFSAQCERELSCLISAVNAFPLSQSSLFLAGTILSATTREVSYCRKDRWKLHRLSDSIRRTHRPNTFFIFERRLRAAIRELRRTGDLTGNCGVLLGDSRDLTKLLADSGQAESFNLLVTSPPYGDSRTTVQYGGMSGICLGVVRYLEGLGHLSSGGSEIDSKCLGGCSLNTSGLRERYRKYWNGGSHNPRGTNVYAYLRDLEHACTASIDLICIGGMAIFVVARRKVGGWRLYIDEFLDDILSSRGLRLCRRQTRSIHRKLLPSQVYPWSRSSKPNHKGAVSTMSKEYILVYIK
jgi:hypothetical protein